MSLALIRHRISDLRDRCSGASDPDGLTLAHFTSIFDVPTAHWGTLVHQSGNMLLSAPYLAALEQHPYRGMCFHYVLVYRQLEPVGMLYFQESDVHITNVEGNVDTSKVGDRSLLSRVKGLVMKGLDSVSLRLLIMGNLLQSGNHGQWFAPELDSTLKAKLTDRVCKTVIDANRSGKRVRGLLIKDVSLELEKELLALDAELTPFEVQPNMEVAIREHWNLFDDVLDDYSSKYRVRAKAAIKKAAVLQLRELNETDIQQQNDRLMELFKAVESQSDFHMVSIHPRYFLDLKAALEDAFVIKAYFLDGVMVGFYTYIKGMGQNNAAFVGIDYEHNREFALYQNMLYALVADAIADGSKSVDLARTAMEIKSTVGAEPVQYRLLVKHLNAFTNKVVSRFIGNIRSKEWEQRRPFRTVA